MPYKALMLIQLVATLAIHALYMNSERAAVCACLRACVFQVE